ncbi:MAG TPA: tetratricopeptide repeat protein, partial [Kofleriaceae bacterium]
KDGWLQLYLGWAQLAKGDAAEATKAFDQAIALAPATKLPALYGEGQAKLLLADIAGARTAFESILAINKDHVCANVGLIATKPASQAMEQVAELEAVLQRKDVTTKQADPRCVVKALTLIGDVHRGAGRLDMARQRYRDALKLVANDVPTLDGLAAVELRDNKPQVAADLIQKALAADAESGETQLLQAELAVRQGKLPDAQTLIDKLAARQPPLPTLAQAHLFVVRGNLLEAKGQDEDAITAYVEGSKLAGDLDLTPVMSAVKKLSELAKKADPAKATEYRNRIDELLKALEQRALEDAQLSTALGVAYLEAGDPAKADNFLRRAVALKGDDPESKLQFARALAAEGKIDEAVSQLKEAQQLDPKRIDIALELARTYQVANRHDDAVAAYDKLLALPDVPIVVRVNAGRYYAQRGMIDKAAAQAEPILKAEPENPGGLYLKAEGLLKADKPEEAGPILTKATDIEADAQYLDALGRALEARYFKSNDGKYIEGARFAYERASKADPKMFHPWLGQGKMLVERKDWDAAVKPLLAASAIDASNASVLYYQGRAYFGLRNAKPEYKKVSAQWLESALKARPELDLASRAEASHLLGELYEDLNKPQDNVRAWENALRLGEEIEKQTGKAPEWLTETYYDLGDLFERLSSFPAQKRVFQRYLDRNPKNATHKTAVQQALLTRLKQY